MNPKTQIYNLIIVDESGSMAGLANATLSGINETISTIRNAQKEFDETQEHFLTLVTFDLRTSNVPAIRTIFDAIPISEMTEFTDYHPNGCTPLYDAMGISLTRLKDKLQGNKNATGVVTVLTDGLENASHEWNATELRKLIEQLKEEGWIFSYMGSAHDVKNVTDLLSIENVVEFSHDNLGAKNTWARESSSRHAYYSKMNEDFMHPDSSKPIKERMKRYAQMYYSERVTPGHIESLQPGQIFVFGSNSGGYHGGGAAAFAMRNFGAIYGQGEGLQGQSYAIPTTDGIELMKESIHHFCEFARNNPDKQFLVTRIGCGIAGYGDEDIAPLFAEAIKIENIALPASFWKVLGLKMFK